MSTFKRVCVFGVKELKHETTLHMEDMLDFTCLFMTDSYADEYPFRRRSRLLH